MRHYCLLRIFYTAFLSCWTLGFLLGQNIQIRNFTVDDGLPSSLTYDAVCDTFGYVWISTENGLVKFDGEDFIENPIQDLPNREFIDLEIDSQNRLWILDLEWKVHMFDQINYFPPDSFPALVNKEVRQVFEDSEQNIWFSHLRQTATVYSEGKFTDYTHGLNGTMFLNEKGDTVVGIGHLGLLNVRRPDQVTKLNVDVPRLYWWEFVAGKVFTIAPNKMWIIDIKTGQMTDFIAFNSKFDAGINRIYKESDKILWACTSKGLVRISFEDKKIHFDEYLRDTYVRNLEQDIYGNFWATTEKEGVYILTKNEVENIQGPDFKTLLLKRIVRSKNKQELIIGTGNSELYVLDMVTREVLSRQIVVKDNPTLYDLSFDFNGELVISTSSYGYANSQITGFKGKIFRPITNDFGWIGTGHFAGYKKNDKLYSLIPERTYALHSESREYAMAGTINGLYKMQANHEVQKFPDERLHVHIRDIKKDRHGTYWVSTRGNGVFHITGSRVIDHFSIEDGLPTNLCEKLFIEEKNVFVCSNKGISIIDKQLKKITTIGKNHGMASWEANDVFADSSTVFVATNNGLSIFPIKKNFESNPPKSRIRKLVINNQEERVSDTHVTRTAANTVEVILATSTAVESGQVEVQYRLMGMDESWTATNKNGFTIRSVPHGKSVLQIRLKTPNSSWMYLDEIEFDFRKPISQMRLFPFIIFLGVIIILGLIFYFIFKNLEKRNRIERALRDSKLQALRAQLNPHFLFNSLNSIQEYIILNDAKSANAFLSKFAKLMRRILFLSGESRVFIDSEIEALQLYLELEGSRFENNFQFDILLDENVNTVKTMIPPLIIQPIVENSIKHGLLHKSGLKKIQIRFNQIDEQTLIVDVIDNGIGRKRAQEIQAGNPKLHTSMGTKLIEQRLDLLNGNKLKTNIEFTDLKDENGPAGTHVRLYINTAD